MKQFYITSAEFYTPGDTGDADAVMDPEQLAALRKASGVTGLLDNAIAASKTTVAEPVLTERKYDVKGTRRFLS